MRGAAGLDAVDAQPDVRGWEVALVAGMRHPLYFPVSRLGAWTFGLQRTASFFAAT
jgi:hypothetical protein